MDTIKIAIADDQLLFRKAIAEVIKNTEEFELITEGDNGDLLLQQLENLPKLPDIVIADLDMPVMNGVQLNEQLRIRYPSIKVIILSVFNQERFINRMIDTGVNSYLAKNCEIKELILAIRTVHRSGFYFNEACLKALREAATNRNNKSKYNNKTQFDITKREIEVLKLICKELNTAEIAEQLFLSTRTVEGHRINLLAKTDCKNIAGLVVFAIKNGFYEPWL